MRMQLAAGLLFCGLSPVEAIHAQGANPDLVREVTAVRAEIARNAAALRQYTWIEHTEVLVSSDLKSSTDVLCRYDAGGGLTKTPIAGDERDKSKAVSRRPMVRKQADMQDYIERAVSRVHTYIPPKPQQIDHLLESGLASFGKSSTGKSEVRFTHYYEDGDSLVFTYDPVSKTLLGVSIASTLGSPKDPVVLNATFETLPDGVNHVSSAVLDAKKRRIQVKLRNSTYQKVAN